MKTVEEWKTYYEDGKTSLKQELENNPEMWENWTKSCNKYLLVSCILIIENSNTEITGKVTGRGHCFIGSDSINDLKLIWDSKFFKDRFDTTVQHFIADTEKREIVEFLSVCM